MATRRAHGEAGTILPWMLGLLMVVMLLAGLSIDMWRAIGAERALSTAADAAAAAGANGIDEAAYRRDGTVQLDPARARDLAAQSLDAQPEATMISGARIDANTGRVSVRVEATVAFTLTRLFLPGGVTVSAVSDAAPRRRS